MLKKGISASSGYAIGKVFIKSEQKINIIEQKIENINFEKCRLNKAIEKSRNDLYSIKEKVEKEVSKNEAKIFESHIMLLDDPEFIGAIISNIEINNINAEKSVKDIVDMYINVFKNIKDIYIKERADDIKDVGKRILNNLLGINASNLENFLEDTIIVSEDLTPSDTAQLDKSKVKAFLIDVGGKTSHTAIMARTLEIPAIVGMVDITHSVKNGDLVIVDGVKGEAIINPSKAIIDEYYKKSAEFKGKKEKLKKFINVKIKDKQDKYIKICGNVENLDDINKVVKNGGDGVGLFRTEFLYMNRETMPSETEQFLSYKYAVEKLNGKSIVIRTLDVGGDKEIPYLHMPKEVNPFLGYRAIRLCLDRKDIFKVQLRAILRASAFGDIKIMFPMISSIQEFLDAKSLLNECMMELNNEGKSFNKNLEVGIMVEVPSVAIMADDFAKYVDFFSIGTNDLIQYTLAADRMNEKVSYLYNPFHPAVLYLIKNTIEAAHKNGKLCSMCGEAAADEKAIPILLQYGLDEFSTSISSILKTKETIMKNINSRIISSY